MDRLETTGKFLSRKLNEFLSVIYRTFVYPFVRAGIEYKHNSIIGKGAYLYKGCILEGKDYIGDKVELANVRVGFSTYIGRLSNISNTRIGKYSCIGCIKTVVGRHPVKGECISIYPAFYSDRAQYGYTYSSGSSFEEERFVDDEKKYNISIGNDVWIGWGVMITDGVTIGDGAVIGAESLVNSDVEPYAIYAGTPAKRIGSRFDEATVEKLLKLRWWDKDEAWLKEHADDFIHPDKFLSDL